MILVTNLPRPVIPNLTDVKGGFNMQSTAQIDCSGYQSDFSSGVIQGKFTCKTTADAKGGLGSGSGTSSGSSPSSTSTKGAAASFGISEAAAGLSVLGGLMQMLL